MAPKPAAAPAPAPSTITTLAESLKNSPLSRISSAWDPLKDAVSRDAAASEGSQANIEMNLKKLKAISKGNAGLLRRLDRRKGQIWDLDAWLLIIALLFVSLVDPYSFE